MTLHFGEWMSFWQEGVLSPICSTCLCLNMFISLSSSYSSFHFFLSSLPFDYTPWCCFLWFPHLSPPPTSLWSSEALKSGWGFYLLFVCFLAPFTLSFVNSLLSYWALSRPVAMACVYRFVSVVRFVHNQLWTLHLRLFISDSLWHVY